MREICTSGSVGGEGGNILTYPAVPRLRLVTDVVGGSGKTPLGWSAAPEPKKPRVVPPPSSGWMDEEKFQNQGAMRRGND